MSLTYAPVNKAKSNYSKGVHRVNKKRPFSPANLNLESIVVGVGRHGHQTDNTNQTSFLRIVSPN
ncbi:MAG: hypothetical protein KC419_00265 [Anaerolineales bacterium]|nr:hypothetical protein [Anaerolineales bacterium]MCA9926867.1 hypothetical protein [Anaerolineales bacterium]